MILPHDGLYTLTLDIGLTIKFIGGAGLVTNGDKGRGQTLMLLTTVSDIILHTLDQGRVGPGNHKTRGPLGSIGLGNRGTNDTKRTGAGIVEIGQRGHYSTNQEMQIK